MFVLSPSQAARQRLKGIIALVGIFAGNPNHGHAQVAQQQGADLAWPAPSDIFDRSSVIGLWRVASGPLGEGLLEINIAETAAGKPDITILGQYGRLGPYVTATSVIATKTSIEAEYPWQVFDLIGYIEGSLKVSGTLADGGTRLKVRFKSANQDTVIVFERDGAKFRRFDVPRLTSDGGIDANYTYAPPMWRAAEDLPVGSSVDASVNAQGLEKAIREGILSGRSGHIDSLLVMKGGKLILEEYFFGKNADALHQMQSMTKSVTSMLYGRALDDKIIANIDDPVIDLLPEYQNTYWAKNNIKYSLRDFLAMRDVVGWNESSRPKGTVSMLRQAWQSPDIFRYLFEMPPVAGKDDRQIAYNTAMSNELGLVLTRRSGLRLDAYAARNFFEPLNIHRFYWGAMSTKPRSEAEAIPWGGSDLWLRPRDMAKMGQMILNRGAWDGKQIVPTPWLVEATTMAKFTPNRHFGYGYQFWLQKFSDGSKIHWAIEFRGSGGQIIAIIPTLDAVVVVGAENKGELEPSHTLLSRYILPALANSSRPFLTQELVPSDIGFRPLVSYVK